jgi:hypothetical protein
VVLVAAVVGGVVGGLLSRKANLKESSPVVTVGPGPFPGQTSSDLGGGLTAQQSSSSDLGGAQPSPPSQPVHRSSWNANPYPTSGIGG